MQECFTYRMSCVQMLYCDVSKQRRVGKNINERMFPLCARKTETHKTENQIHVVTFFVATVIRYRTNSTDGYTGIHPVSFIRIWQQLNTADTFTFRQ